jgi:hypothetical protein
MLDILPPVASGTRWGHSGVLGSKAMRHAHASIRECSLSDPGEQTDIAGVRTTWPHLSALRSRSRAPADCLDGGHPLQRLPDRAGTGGHPAPVARRERRAARSPGRSKCGKCPPGQLDWPDMHDMFGLQRLDSVVKNSSLVA